MPENLDKLRTRKDAATYIREQYARPCTVGLLNKLAVRGKGQFSERWPDGLLLRTKSAGRLGWSSNRRTANLNVKSWASKCHAC